MTKACKKKENVVEEAFGILAVSQLENRFESSLVGLLSPRVKKKKHLSSMRCGQSVS